MPDIDGLTLVHSFLTNPETAGTPVIVLSGNDDAGSRAKALAQGAKDYLVKLPPKAALIACIRQHASRSAGGSETLDASMLERFAGAGAEEFTRHIIDQFLAEACVRVKTLNDAAGRAGRVSG